MRVVIDTNVLISSILNPNGPPAQVIYLLFEDKIKLCMDNRILNEYNEVLHRKKFGFSKSDIGYLLQYIEENAENIIGLPLNIRLNDPDDLKFYEVFIASHSDYLVTGDLKDFMVIKDRRICDPGKFIKLFHKI